MQSRLNPYIGFKDKAREAMEFYHTVFGGKLDMTTFKDGMGGMPVEPSDENKIMHSMLESDNGITFMASDAPSGMNAQSGSQINMSLSGDNETELRGYWDKLVEGGTITLPLEQAPWGDTFGMLTDKFGICWMVNVTSKNA